MNTKDAIQLAIFGVIAWLVYDLLKNKLPQATQPVANWIADFYLWAILPPSMMPLGNVILPDGTPVPASSPTLDVRKNGDMTVALYAGHYYQLAPSDAYGNWPATLIQ